MEWREVGGIVARGARPARRAGRQAGPGWIVEAG
jgi:hypothetical protein